MKKIISYFLISISVLTSCHRVGITLKRERGENLSRERLEIPATTPKEQVIEHIGYTTSYNSKTLNPDWVAYELTQEELQGNKKGSESFCWDPDVKGRKSKREDYKNKDNWDKGHMAPKADMKWSVQAYEESFYLSNICPQNRSLNGGDWLKTENLARRMAKRHGKAYIVCGPVFNDRKFGVLGENKVWIPDGFFKAILVPTKGRYESIAFYMTNTPQKNNLKNYVYTVDDIEKLISRDLFVSLDDKIEKRTESVVNSKFWGL